MKYMHAICCGGIVCSLLWLAGVTHSYAQIAARDTVEDDAKPHYKASYSKEGILGKSSTAHPTSSLLRKRLKSS